MPKPPFQWALTVFDEVLRNSKLTTEKLWVRASQVHLGKGPILLLGPDLSGTSEGNIRILYESHTPKKGGFFVFYVVGLLSGVTICTLLGDQFTLDNKANMKSPDIIRTDWNLIFYATESWGEAEIVESKTKWQAIRKRNPSQLSNLDYMFV